MLALVGLVVGALAGRVAWGEWGAVVGGLVGFIAGAMVSTQRQRAAHRQPEAVANAGRSDAARLGQDAARIASPVDAFDASATELRIAALEQRVSELETALREGRPADREGVPTPAIAPAARAPIAEVPTVPTHAPVMPAAESPAGAFTARPPNPLWAWFTGGNAMTRIGVIVLFFGVAFLLRYFAEHFTIPVEAKLLAVAAVGVALVLLGLRMAAARPAYGWSLQGAGTGVLYLTAFAAFREYAVIGAGAGFALLAIVAALTIWLALEADAQPLAGLALAGAFLAPMLTGVEHDPLILFGYFALVDLVVLAVAWSRPWRAVYLLGAAFTFLLALVWGNAYYRPEHYAVVQPFLALYFAIYVAIAVLQARLAAVNPSAPLDGLLVFGVPLVAFALQAALVSDREYGAACSALVVALLYGALAFVLRRRSEAALQLLARVFTGLAVVFATIAIPFALDNRWTAALWSVEAALVFWLGMKQRTRSCGRSRSCCRSPPAPLFAVSGIAGDDDRLFANAFFTGTTLVSVAALATVWIADRDPERLTAGERTLLPLFFAWGALWWLGGGTFELIRQLPRAREGHAVLAWVVACASLALLLRRPFAWRRLETMAWALPVTMAFVGMRDIERAHTTLTHVGWLVWPLAWVVYVYLLRVADGVGAALAPALGADSPGADPESTRSLDSAANPDPSRLAASPPGTTSRAKQRDLARWRARRRRARAARADRVGGERVGGARHRRGHRVVRVRRRAAGHAVSRRDRSADAARGLAVRAAPRRVSRSRCRAHRAAARGVGARRQRALAGRAVSGAVLAAPQPARRHPRAGALGALPLECRASRASPNGCVTRHWVSDCSRASTDSSCASAITGATSRGISPSCSIRGRCRRRSRSCGRSPARS